MVKLVESTHASAALVGEECNFYSRETIQIAPNTTIEACTVLGKLTAGGAYTGLAPGAADGSETALAVAIYGISTGASGGEIAAWVRGPVSLRRSDIVWSQPGITDAQKTAALTALEALGFVFR
jgi:Bacteriophage lambda head decoration protein D